MSLIGIIGAMEKEVAELKSLMAEVSVTEKAGMKFYRGTLEGKPAVVVQSGVGKVNAGMCTQILADLFHVDYVLNTGIAGSLHAAIDIGDIVISTDAVQHDVDATAWQYQPGELPGMGRVGFPGSEKLLTMAEAVCGKVNPDIRVFRGRVVTGDQFINDQKVKDQLKEQFGGYCTEMEGGAIAQAAYLNQIPFLIIRVISDKADGSAVNDDIHFEDKVIRHCVNLVCGMVREL